MGTTFKRVIKLGYNNFWRSRWLTLGATLLMTLTLTMITVSLIMSFVIRDTTDTIRSKIDLTVYFRDDAVTDIQISQLGEAIKGISNVSEVTFIDKKEALKRFSALPINRDIIDPLSDENNPLPRSLLIDTNNPDVIESIVTALPSIDTGSLICSDCVSFAKNKDTVTKLVAVTRLVQRVGVVLSLFFGIIAIFNVSNIIRLTIMTRSDEIEIMRYVGASNLFVRGPFIIEGILYGVLGTIFTTFFIYLSSYLISRYALNSISGSAVALLGVDLYAYVVHYFWLLILAQLAVGLLLGVLVSSFSIRRFLRS